jgi:hypothetical protein
VINVASATGFDACMAEITSVRSELDLVAPAGLNSADNGRSRRRAEFYD